MLDHHRSASETPFKWRLKGVSLADPIMARFYWYLDPVSPPSCTKKKPKRNQIKQNKKVFCRVGPPQTKLSGYAQEYMYQHIMRWSNYIFQCTGGKEVCNLIQVTARNDRWECVTCKYLQSRLRSQHHFLHMVE